MSTTAPNPAPSPELFNWIVEVTVGDGSVLLWITGCSGTEEEQVAQAQGKAREQALALTDAYEAGGLPRVSQPVNMGSGEWHLGQQGVD